MVLIKVLIYTGVRVQELVNNKIEDICFNTYQIRLTEGKDRTVLFPQSFCKDLMMYVKAHCRMASSICLSHRKKPFTPRGIRKILANYAAEAGMKQSLSPYQ